MIIHPKVMQLRQQHRPIRHNSNIFAMFDQKQISELKETFSFLDQDGNGTIDREDLREVWNLLGSGIEDEVILDEMLKEPGSPVSFTIFLAMLGDRIQHFNATINTKALVEAFEHFDTSHSGLVAISDLRRALKMPSTDSQPWTDDKIDLFLAGIGESCNGEYLNYHELVKMLKAPI